MGATLSHNNRNNQQQEEKVNLIHVDLDNKQLNINSLINYIALGHDLLERDKIGRIPLIKAVLLNNYKYINTILKHSDTKHMVDICDIKYNRTALHYACKISHKDLNNQRIAIQDNLNIIKLLCKYGGSHSINLKDKKNKTCLHYALDNGRSDIIRLIYLENYEIKSALWGKNYIGDNDILKYAKSSHKNSNKITSIESLQVLYLIFGEFNCLLDYYDVNKNKQKYDRKRKCKISSNGITLYKNKVQKNFMNLMKIF